MDTDDEAFQKQVGRRLRAARHREGLSLREVAARLEIKAFQTVASWETGVNPIDTRRLHQLSRLYKTSIAALLVDRLSKDEISTLLSDAAESAAPATQAPRKQRGSRA